jgi:hypothetical protein
VTPGAVRWVKTGAAVLAGHLIAAAAAGAQGPKVTHELRVDAIVARRSAIEGGGSLIVPAGLYARTALTAAAGVAASDSGSAAVGRVELLSRFLLDPYREWPYGLSLGGGVGVTNLADTRRWRPYLACALDLELRRIGQLTPAIQIGLGGGARLGMSLRSGASRWR